ncbi:hypothetical protein Tco_1517948 [Tanacetum coccineum]
MDHFLQQGPGVAVGVALEEQSEFSLSFLLLISKLVLPVWLEEEPVYTILTFRTIRDPIAEGKNGAQQLGPERAQVYSDLSSKDKDRYNADIRATNILLQGLPKYIYTLINHYTEAKDIWDNVKMLLDGSELMKEDQESQLYDDFEHFRQNKGETIHDYYVWFSKLINNIRKIKMTMSRMQLNSKFVNNMLSKWGRFVTAVKLNRGTSSNTRNQAIVQDGRVVVQNVHGQKNRGQGNNARGGGAAGYWGAQNRVGNATPGQARQIKRMGWHWMKSSYCLLQVDKTTLLIKMWMSNLFQDLALNVDNVFQADDCDAFDSDVDEAPTAQTMFMANLSSADPVYDEADPVYDEAGPSYDLDILSEVHGHDHYQDAICEHHEEHEIHDDV